MIKKCLGCGAILQSDNKDDLGYIINEKLESADYCERCFKIINYGIFKKVDIDSEVFTSIKNEIKKSDDLILFLADIFTLDNALKMIDFFDKSKIILVITKYDIIPKSVKINKLYKKIENYGLKNKVIETVFISCSNNYNIDYLYNLINKNKNTNKVYVVGNTNAGKSTFINKILKNYTNCENIITTSILPNTTINLNNIFINEDLILIDTPGFMDEYNITNYIQPSLLKKVMPKSEIRPITYQLESGKTLYVENMMRIEYVNGEKNSFTFYISNDIIVSRINTVTNKRCLNLKKVRLNVRSGEDVIINGLCFIKITKDAIVDIYTYDEKIVSKRNSLI